MGDVVSKMEASPYHLVYSPAEQREDEEEEFEVIHGGLGCKTELVIDNDTPGLQASWGPWLPPATRKIPSARTIPGDTVIIFDWDDTLLCTSAINANEWSQKQLSQLERAVEVVLRSAMLLGEVLIVTNGIESWVENSASRFLPGLLPLLSRLQVTSARAWYETSHPGDPFMWKKQAFKELLCHRKGRLDRMRDAEAVHCDDSIGLNLVVIGDGHAEMEAAQNIGKVFRPNSLIKTVKFKEYPSVAELLGQLRRVVQELGQIVEERTSSSHGLVQKVLPENLEHLATWASGWQCSIRTGAVDSVKAGGGHGAPLSGIWPCMSWGLPVKSPE
jgi:hypothetical protein